MAIKLFSRWRKRRPLTGVGAQPQVVTIHGETIALRPEFDIIKRDPDSNWVTGIWDRSKNSWVKQWPRPKH